MTWLYTDPAHLPLLNPENSYIFAIDSNLIQC